MLTTEEETQETHKQIKDIPKDWKVRRLGDVAHLERGKFSARPRNDPKYFGGHIPFIQTGDVRNSNGQIKSYSQTLNNDGLRVSKLFPAKTLFFTIAANIGDVGIAGFATACPDSLVAISPKSKIDKMWMFQALKYRKREFESLATQNAQLNINLEKLLPYLIAIPPIHEQQTIAAVLNNIDFLINSLDQLIAKKRDIKLAAMQQLLTGKQRLPGFNEEWEKKKLGGIAHINMGQSPDSRYYNTNKIGTPLIQGNADIKNRKSVYRVWTTDITKACDKGDLILTVRAPVGSIGIATNTSCLGRGVCSLKPMSISTDFLFHAMVFAEEDWKILEQGSTFTSANSAQIAEFPIMIPNNKDEQTAIANILSDMDTELSTLEQQLDKTRNLKQGMMQELLTGRIRLI